MGLIPTAVVTPVRVLLVSGSMRESGRTHAAIARVARALEAAGAVPDVLTVRAAALPLMDPDAPEGAATRHLRERVRAADALVFASPEYHGGPAGALKNLIDHLTGDDFDARPVALVSAAGGRRGGTDTLNGLRLVFRNLHARVIPQQVAVSGADFHYREVDGDVAKRLDALARALLEEVRRERVVRDVESAAAVTRA